MAHIILLWANPLQGPLQGVRPESLTLLGTELAMSKESAILAQKRFSRAYPFQWPE
jgi:hypothetical protein